MPTLSPPLVAGGGRRNNTYNARDSGGATLSTWLVRLIAGGFFLYLFSLAFTSYYVGSGTATSTKQCKKTQPMQTPRYDISQILAHPWLRQSIAKYEPMDFSWKRRCRNIDWTRYAAELRMRVHAGYQRCALEAAVTVNPAHKVVLYARTLSRDAFMAAELANNPAWQVLMDLPNFEMEVISSDREYFQGFHNRTGLSDPLDFVDKGLWKEDSFLSSQLSDMYRWVVMHEHGGVYADLDSISIQDLRRYPSGKTWLVSDLEKVPKGLHEGFLISGIFGDVARGALTRTALKLFNKRYKPNDWGVVGPKLVTEAARDVAENGYSVIELLKTWDFMPIHWSQGHLLAQRWATLEPDDLFAISHANHLHVFGGRLLFADPVLDDGKPPPNSLLGVVMANRCPLTYCKQKGH